jgi:L-ascorbate metabolism protein UlaG (beta-lactamase superfamily)
MDDGFGQVPSRGRMSRVAAALRSGLRRYPSAIAKSLFTREAVHHAAIDGLLSGLLPHDLAISWLGHASVVCKLEGAMVVVDPVFSSRIGPRLAGRTIGLPRLAPPPVRASDLKEIDLLLVTHAHFDHLDKPTLRAMANPRTVVIVPTMCARSIPTGFGRVIELPSGQTADVGDLHVTAIEPAHWGARAMIDRGRRVNSYLVRSRRSSILFAGDTARTDAFRTVTDVDVAVFGIGAYEPWDHMHATPEQVWAMFEAIGARRLLPVHHSTYELSDEPLDEPMRRLLQAAGESQGRVLMCEPGEVLVIPRQVDRGPEGAVAG